MDDLSEYERIPSGFRNLVQDERMAKSLYKFKWIATEKLHGANFSLVYVGKKLRFAKRKEYLSWQDDFFGFQLFISKNENRVLEIFEQLERDFKAEKIIIYGELVGGMYPHPDVKPDANVRPIQTGIYYSPTIEFCAFDIAVEYDGGKCYLDYYTALKYLTGFGFLHAKIISSGKLQDLLDLDLKMNSFLPQQLGLPKLESNIIEGVVIKPLDFSPQEIITSRPTLKIKNPQFQETALFHQAEKWSYAGTNISNAQDLEFIVDELRNYVTTNRLNSVLSKTGHLDSGNFNRRLEVETLFLDDVLKSFGEDHADILNELNEEQKSWVSKRTLSSIVQLLD